MPTGIGLGWLEINKQFGESRIVEKTGGGADYQTYIALNPARHTGIFVALTDGRRHSAGNMFRESNDLLLTMAGLPPVPVDPDDPERERTGEEIEEAREVAAKPVHARAGRHAAAVRPAAAAKSATRPGHTARPAHAAKPHTAAKPAAHAHTAKPVPKHKTHH